MFKRLTDKFDEEITVLEYAIQLETNGQYSTLKEFLREVHVMELVQLYKVGTVSTRLVREEIERRQIVTDQESLELLKAILENFIEESDMDKLTEINMVKTMLNLLN